MKKKFPWLELIKHFVTAVLTFLAAIGVNSANEQPPVEINHRSTDTVILQMMLPEIPSFDTIPVSNDYFSPSKFKHNETQILTWPSQKFQKFTPWQQGPWQNSTQINNYVQRRLLALSVGEWPRHSRGSARGFRANQIQYPRSNRTVERVPALIPRKARQNIFSHLNH